MSTPDPLAEAVWQALLAYNRAEDHPDFRNFIAARLRDAGVEMGLDVERLAALSERWDREHHDPEHGRWKGSDEDPIYGELVREEAEWLAREYAAAREASRVAGNTASKE